MSSNNNSNAKKRKSDEIQTTTSAPSAARRVSESSAQARPPPDKELVDIAVDRDWTRKVAFHVKECLEVPRLYRSEQNGFATTDYYKCNVCSSTLVREPSGPAFPNDEKERKRCIRKDVMKKMALGIPLGDYEFEFGLLCGGSESEIAATLEEPFQYKNMEMEADREWTREISEHVLACHGAIDFVDFSQDLFELKDRYCCRACGKTLVKEPARVAGAINRSYANTLAKEAPTITLLECYHLQRSVNFVGPTLEELTEYVESTKTEDQREE